VATAAAREGGNGFVVRDLSPLQDGHYYFPALSIPFAGGPIAALNDKGTVEFWGEAYARALGRAKARLLVRYGLQMETPNAQNVLIQLDRRLRPTGVIVFRDVSDSFTTRPILEAIGEAGTLAEELSMGLQPLDRLEPMTENSFWRMDADLVHGLPRQVIGRWELIHDEGYVEEILRMTGIDPASARGRAIRTVKDAQDWLLSPEGLAAVARLHHHG
jgi:hypothetical protein